MKKIYFVICVIAILTLSCFPTFAAEGITVYVNDVKVDFDVEPQLINGRTMVPMRAIFEKLGAEVTWVADTQMIVGKKDDKTVIMQVDDNALVVGENVTAMDVAPTVVDGRTLVPVRAVAESLNVDVAWNEELQRVIITQNNEENKNQAVLGKELASDRGWIFDGWTGSFQNGFKHIIGQTTPLIFSMPEKTGKNLYLVEFDVTDCSKASSPNASVAFSVTVGNSDPFITYNGGGPKHYSFGIRSKEDGDLKIILTEPADPLKTGGTFDGTIKNVSVKRITDTYAPVVEIYDTDGNVSLELRTNDSKYSNVYIGKNVGEYNTTGELNVGIGDSALSGNTSGYWNTAIGASALRDNTVGSRNVAIGRLALADNISGDRNYAIGTFALTRNTTGRYNIAIGADALWKNTTGERNIAIGSSSQSEIIQGNDNISIGQGAMASKTKGDANIAIGSYAQNGNNTSKGNIAIGQYAQYKGGGGNYNINIGHTSGNKMTTVVAADGSADSATSNVGVGTSTLANTTTGKYNVSVGHSAGSGNVTGNSNVYVGMFAGKDATGGSNTFVGGYSGTNVTSGSNNIMVGNSTNPPTPESSYQVNIGNVIYADAKEKVVGVSKANDGSFKAKLDIGASDGKYPPLALSAGKLVTQPVDGAIEYDGENIYITVNGVREKVVLESDVEKIVEETIKKYLSGNAE